MHELLKVNLVMSVAKPESNKSAKFCFSLGGVILGKNVRKNILFSSLYNRIR